MFEVIIVIPVVLAIAIAVVLILAASKPAAFSVERAITIAAPAERIFPTISINGDRGRPGRRIRR
jgi:hypothetical protein